MTTRNVSVAVVAGGLIAFLLYNLGFRASSLTPINHLDLDTSKVISQAKSLATQSWEYATAAQALLELHNPELSVFGADPFPADKVPFAPFHSVESLEFARPHISTSSNDSLFPSDTFSISNPASLGISAILLGQTDVEYLKAAQRQAKYLLESAPRLQNGAISYRKDILEARTEFLASVPPFLAYYAVVSQDLSYLAQSREQIQLYKKLLIPLGTPGRRLWSHIVAPDHPGAGDKGFWAAGNGLVALGLTHVLATARKWKPSASSESFQDFDAELIEGIKEILNGAIGHDTDTVSNLVRNYLADKEKIWAGEVGGTALLAATVYRMAVLEPEGFGGARFVKWAEGKANAVVKHVDRSTGIAGPVVGGPMSSDGKGSGKETEEIRDWGKLVMTGTSGAQSWVGMMVAARRDYLEFVEAKKK